MIYSQGILSSKEGRNPGAAVVVLVCVLVGFNDGLGVMVKWMRPVGHCKCTYKREWVSGKSFEKLWLSLRTLFCDAPYWLEWYCNILA